MGIELPPTEGQAMQPPSPTTAGAVFGNYRVVSKLGQGGMGAVLLATHMHLGVKRALKLIRPSLAHHAEAVARFQREMMAAGSLEHENIARAYDAGQVNGVHYLAMEYADGPDVRKIVKHRNKLRPADAAEIVRQAALGLEEIRRQNLVHRDIKSSNMLITRNGAVKLLDLGLARSLAGIAGTELSSITIGGAVLGTADYMAPEQADNSTEVDIRADIYSLGCAFYEMLVGQPPFNGPSYDSWTRKVIAHASKPVELTAEIRQQLPPGIVSVLLKMLCKSPDERYQTPQEVATALLAACDGADLVQLIKEQPPWEIQLDSDEAESLLTGSHTPSVQVDVTTRPLSGDTPSQAPAGQPTRTGLQIKITIAVFALLLVCLAAAGGMALVSGWGARDNIGEADASAADADPVAGDGAVEDAGEGHGKTAPPAERTTTKELRDYTAAEANLWHNLMLDEPVRTMWDDTSGRSHSLFEPRKQQLFVFSRSIALMGMGKTRSRNFDFEVTIHQDDWSTGVGVFWGFHPDPYEGSGAPSFEPPVKHNLFHYLQFVDKEEGIYGFKMQRGDYKKYHLPDDEKLLSGTTARYTPIKLAVHGELTLKIQIRDGKLNNVLVENEALDELCTAAVNEKLKDFPPDGVFGCFCYGAAANFRSARYKNIK